MIFYFVGGFFIYVYDRFFFDWLVFIVFVITVIVCCLVKKSNIFKNLFLKVRFLIIFIFCLKFFFRNVIIYNVFSIMKFYIVLRVGFFVCWFLGGDFLCFGLDYY